MDLESISITNKTSFIIEFFAKLPSIINSLKQALMLSAFLIKKSIRY